jgi:hypothetical protein
MVLPLRQRLGQCRIRYHSQSAPALIPERYANTVSQAYPGVCLADEQCYGGSSRGVVCHQPPTHQEPHHLTSH